MCQLRQDRILDEASETADPPRLMRLSGVAEGTAVRSIAAGTRRRRSARSADPPQAR
jgi:hypothetical protein